MKPPIYLWIVLFLVTSSINAYAGITLTYQNPTDVNNANVARNYTFINVTTNATNPVRFRFFANVSGSWTETPIWDNTTLIAWINCNNITNTNRTYQEDLSNYKSNATCSDGALRNSCPLPNSSRFMWGKSCGFDSARDKSWAIADADYLDISNAFTLCTWFLVNTNGMDAMITHRGGGFSNFAYGATTSSTPDGHISNYDNTAEIISSFLPANDTWYYHCMIIDGTTVKFYTFGNLTDTMVGNSPPGTTGRLFFGHTDNAGSNGLYGLLDEPKLWSKVFNNTEVNLSQYVVGYRIGNSWMVNFSQLKNGTYSYYVCLNSSESGESNSVCTSSRVVNMGPVTNDVTPPKTTNYNLTNANCTVWNIDRNIPCNTSSLTPTVKFDTDESAYCAIAASALGILDKNHTDMGESRQCTGPSAGEGTQTHSCTVTNQDSIVYESSYIYISCKDENGNQNSTSTSGPLKLNVTELETTARDSIELGISNALLSGYSIYNDQKLYARNAANSQSVGVFDKVAKKLSKIWAFNRIGVADNNVNMFNVTPVLFTFEFANKTSTYITNQTELLINATK